MGCSGGHRRFLLWERPCHMLPVCCPRPKAKGALTGVSPCQNTLARGSPDWTRISPVLRHEGKVKLL
jgi:hypothetical protein